MGKSFEQLRKETENFTKPCKSYLKKKSWQERAAIGTSMFLDEGSLDQYHQYKTF